MGAIDDCPAFTYALLWSSFRVRGVVRGCFAFSNILYSMLVTWCRVVPVRSSVVSMAGDSFWAAEVVRLFVYILFF